MIRSQVILRRATTNRVCRCLSNPDAMARTRTRSRSRTSQSPAPTQVRRKRAIGYTRVSTDQQVDQGVSLGMQREKVVQYCELHDLDLVDLLVEDGQSGKDLERPKVRELLRRMRAGLVDAVVVYKLDRLTRAPRDLYLLVDDELNPRGIDLHSVSEHLDSRTPSGRAMMGLMGVFAQMEREVIGARTREALRHKAEQGYLIHAPALGFRAVGGGITETDAQEIAVVRHVLDLCDADLPFHRIADRLNAEGVPTKRGGRWHASTVHRIYGRREMYREALS